MKYIDAEDLNLEVRQPMPYILIYVVVQCALLVFYQLSHYLIHVYVHLFTYCIAANFQGFAISKISQKQFTQIS